MNTTTEVQLPKWRSHKKVLADRIEAFRFVATDDPKVKMVVLTLRCGVEVQPRRKLETNGAPFEGGYYVRYDDGYESWSPAAAFEDGYTRIEP